MDSDRDDILLDTCLDEVLGGHRPPDLTARIMQAFAARAHANGNLANGNANGSPANSASHVAPVPPPVLAAVHQPAPSNGQAVVEVSRRTPPVRLRRSRSSEAWLLVAGVLVLAAAVGVVAYMKFPGEPDLGPPIAKNPNSKPGAATIAEANATPKPGPAEVRPQIPKPVADKRLTPERPLVVDHSPKLPDRQTTPEVASNNSRPPIAPTTPLPPKAYPKPSSDAEVVSFVNAEIARGISENGVKPAGPATDAEWCRRLFVRVLGRIPTIDELDQFTADKAKDRREKLVQRLLSDERYVAQYADHWSSVWANVLIGRTGGQAGSLASREGLEQYLRTALAGNKRYDEVVRELLTATGSAKAGAADFNPAVNFLLDGLDKDATLATARVSRVFLGQQLACAQCHQHPTEEKWSQEKFWAINSFLRQMQGEKADGAGNLVNVNFPGQGRGSAAGEVFYETPAGLLKTAYPTFIDGTAIPTSGDLAEVDRRGELAKFVVASDQLPKALVNRVWSHFFGFGFTRPVDDLGPSTTPSHPQLLDRLATEFAARDFDVKSVIRWIALSEPFGRSSKLTDIATKDMPEAGEVALFSRYYSRPMQAEEVYNSLVQAAQMRKSATSDTALAKARVDWLSQFSRNMGTDDAQEEHHTGGVRQSLIMMNGDLMKQAVSSQQGGVLKNVAASNMKFDKKVEHLFRAAFSREPTRKEQEAANSILRNSRGVEQTALEDIWWAILNSNEFILDH